MVELIRTNNAVMLSWLMSVFDQEGIDAVILDNHVSAVEGSICVFTRRVMVADDDYTRARMVLAEAHAIERNGAPNP